MNKLTKLMLASAVMVTTGFSAEVEIGGNATWEGGTTVELENGCKYVFPDGAVLHNYSTVVGPTGDEESVTFELKAGATSARVINYTDQLQLDGDFSEYEDMNGNYYVTCGKGDIKGNVNVDSGITVKTVSADAYNAMSKLPVGVHTIVFAGESEGTITMSNMTGEVMEINHNLANEVEADSEYVSKGLIMKGKYDLKGNNSHMNAEGTVVKLTDAEVVFTGSESLFNADIFLDAYSSVAINGAKEFSKELRAVGGKIILGDGFVLKSGASLILEKGVVYEIEKVGGEARFSRTDGTQVVDGELMYLSNGNDVVIVRNNNALEVYNTEFDSGNYVMILDGKINYGKLKVFSDSENEIYSGSCSFKELFDFFENIKNGVLGRHAGGL